MPSIRIYQKKQIRLDRLKFRQTQMFKIGNVGVAAVKNRRAAAEGPTDGSAKPLTKRYAIWKTKLVTVGTAYYRLFRLIVNVDAALLAKIRGGDDPKIDAFEAMKVVEQLSLAEVDDVVPDGDTFKITLRVLGATTVHLLKMPSAKDVFEYRRGFARLLDLPFGRQEVTINIGSAAALYKKLVTPTKGYVGGVPIIHQAVAVKAAIDAMDTAFAEDREASF